MVDKQIGDDIERAVNTGADNATIRPDCEGWCEHIVVETLGISMVGQMMGVPIGPHRISCQHASGSLESVALRNLFGWFVEQNCVGCKNYSAGSRPEFGRQTIDEIEAGKKERQRYEREKVAKIAKLRDCLTESAKVHSESAKPEAASIHRLAIDLFKPEADENVVPALLDCCEVAPEFFDAEIVELLLVGISDAEFADRCLPVLTSLARKRPGIREKNQEKVISTIQLPIQIELVSDAIDAFIEHAENLADEQIDLLIGRLDHQREIVGSFLQEPRKYPKSISLLFRFGTAARARLLGIVAKRLDNGNSVVRANACKTLDELTKLDFSLGLELLPNVIQMLELPEESNFGVSSDHSAKNFIAEMMAADWPATFKMFDEQIRKLSNEARSVAVGALDQLFHRGPNWRDETTCGLDEATVEGAVTFCLERFCDPIEDPAIRHSAAVALKSAASAKVDLMIKSVDRLLGTYVLMIDAVSPAPVKRIIIPGHEHSSEHEMLRAQQATTNWAKLQHETLELLEQLGEEAGEEICETLIATIETATVQKHTQLRATAIKLLGKIATQNSQLAARSLPVFMKGMMDFSAAHIRAVSLDAVTDCLRYCQLTIPENVGDAFVLLLKDTFIMVHKTAVQTACRWRHSLTDQQRDEAFQALYNLWRYYIKQPNEVFFLDDIAVALIRIARANEDMRVLAIRLVAEAIPTGESLVDRKLLEAVLNNCDFDDPNIIAVAEKVMLGLKIHQRNTYSSEKDWRTKAFEWFHRMPKNVWDAVNATLHQSALECIERVPYDAYFFASLFSEHGQHTQESALLIAGSDKAKGHNIYNGLEKPLRALAECANQMNENTNV